MSTNDQVTLLASGASGVTPDRGRLHRRRSPTLCADLAAAAAGRRRGREPRHHDRGARRRHAKTTPSRSAARSPATTSSRPRSSATTRTGAACSPRSARPSARSTRTTSTCAMNGVRVCHAGRPDRPRDEVDLTPRATHVLIDLHARRAHPPPCSRTTSRTTTCTRTARTRAHERRLTRPTARRHGDDPTTATSRRPRPRHSIESLPWLKRFHGEIVVVKFGGNAMVERRAAARLRRGHGVPALRRDPPGGGARRWPADLGDARAARHPERVQGRLPRDHARDDGRRAHGAHRPGQPRARRA